MEVEPTQPTVTVSEVQAHELESTEFERPELAMDIIESVDSICRDSEDTQYMLIQTNF